MKCQNCSAETGAKWKTLCFSCYRKKQRKENPDPKCRVCRKKLDQPWKKYCIEHWKRSQEVRYSDCECLIEGYCLPECEYCEYRKCPVTGERPS